MRNKGAFFSTLFTAFLLESTGVFAHEGKPHTYHDLWRTWAFEPTIVFGLAISALLYAYGLKKLWRFSRGLGISLQEAVWYATGWFTLFIALVSPLHPWGRVLFSAHMGQHELLMLIAAPLLVLGRPIVPFLWALPRKWSRQLSARTRSLIWQNLWRFLTIPLIAWVIHAIVLWIWHIPFLFQATLRSEMVHTAQHLSFLFSALLFWWALIHGRQSAMGYGMAVLYMFTTAMHSGLLGALLTFANSLWYPAYSETTQSWGLTPLQDQHLGGLIMWIPAGAVYLVAGLALFAGWLRESGRRVQVRESILRMKSEPERP